MLIMNAMDRIIPNKIINPHAEGSLSKYADRSIPKNDTPQITKAR